MNVSRIVSSLVLVAACAAFLPACLLIRTTEHRIKLNDKGGGEALLRLIDIRSDGASDTLVARDYAIMMASVQTGGVERFELGGRKVTSRQFYASGDTLTAELVYTFPNLDGIEGLKVKLDEMFFVVPETREVVKTNGKIESWANNEHRIVWPRDAKRLMYQIREKTLQRAVSLAPLYLKYGYTIPEGAK